TLMIGAEPRSPPATIAPSTMVPVAVAAVISTGVFNSTDTVLALMLATLRSGLPSPFTSDAATERGLFPVAKVCWVANDAGVAPGAVVLTSTDTVSSFCLAPIRSGLPSPFTSDAATERGAVPVAKVCWVAKDGVLAPGAVVFNSTDTVLLVKLATIRSG